MFRMAYGRNPPCLPDVAEIFHKRLASQGSEKQEATPAERFEERTQIHTLVTCMHNRDTIEAKDVFHTNVNYCFLTFSFQSMTKFRSAKNLWKRPVFLEYPVATMQHSIVKLHRRLKKWKALCITFKGLLHLGLWERALVLEVFHRDYRSQSRSLSVQEFKKNLVDHSFLRYQSL